MDARTTDLKEMDASNSAETNIPPYSIF